jgi:hypothetical protein
MTNAGSIDDAKRNIISSFFQVRVLGFHHQQGIDMFLMISISPDTCDENDAGLISKSESFTLR